MIRTEVSRAELLGQGHDGLRDDESQAATGWNIEFEIAEDRISRGIEGLKCSKSRDSESVHAADGAGRSTAETQTKQGRDEQNARDKDI